MLFFLGGTATIAALTGLGLSFTALSPLVMGGIVAVVPVTLFVACVILNKIKEKELSKKDFFLGAYFCIASAAVGVGLAAACTAIFPSATLGMGSAALAGATIGVIAPIATFCADAATAFAARKVNEYIISPVVKSFSSKGEERNLSAK
ncbi:hypothetical protein [Wolbachia endosymbiont (group A) of Myopa testacea]|uniref:hypothetical protein n=1 Tax=Wolbachia endosymbiont (group A) of Myopa testacea TaxID=3066148 RepID=UPI003132BF63